MLATPLLWQCAVLGALVTGPYSGVDVDHLLATPILAQQNLFRAEGAQLAGYATGLTLEQREGKPVGVTQQDFSCEFSAQGPVGRYIIIVNCAASNGGNDSFWVDLDGTRLEDPLTLTVGTMAERSLAVRFTTAGPHKLRLSLREGAGSVLQSVRLAGVQVRPPRPAMRRELMTVHPRLLLTAADVPALRARLQDSQVKRFYTVPQSWSKTPPAYNPTARNGGSYRSLPNAALGNLLQPDDKQLAALIAWLDKATTYGFMGADLDAEYFLEGVALTYDWTYDKLPEELRVRVRNLIAEKCRLIYELSLSGMTGGGFHYQQNHYWYAHLALAIGAAAICGEVPEAEGWLAWAWDRYERIALSFGPDGGFHEGVSYWDFSMPTLYLYTDLYEWCSGVKAPALDTGLRGQAEFRFHHLYPGLKLSAPLEDAHVPVGKPPLALLLWTAKRFHDPVAQGMAETLSEGPQGSWANLLSLDEKLPGKDPRTVLPLARRYPDIETAFARTSWAEDATFASFISRPMGGHLYADLCVKYGIGGTGHNHPEQNGFVLFGRGETLADDTGYTYSKQTRDHNTILVDGKGQYGDGQMWPAPNAGRAHIIGLATAGDLTIVRGDATSAYPAVLGLQRFVRTFVLAGRDLVVVFDQLQAAEPKTFSWLLHHHGQITQQGGNWIITRGQAQLTVAPQSTLEGVTSTYRPSFIHPTRDLTPKEADVNLLELKTQPTREANLLVPLLIGEAGSPAPTPQRVSGPGYEAVQVGQTLVAFRTGAGEMTVKLPWGGETRTKAAVLIAREQGGKRQVLTCE